MAVQADQADPVQDLCDRLAGYLPRLEQLVAEPDSHAQAYGDRMQGRISAAPLPGNAPALLAATGIHGVARWWEAVLLYHHGGSGVWGRRGGSDANTVLALEAIMRLAAAADRDTVRMLLRDLGRAEADAAAVPDAGDDQQQRQEWRRLRGRPCPRCGCYWLAVLLDGTGRRVECHGHRADGTPCRAAAEAGTDASGRAVLDWGGGLTETAPDLEEAS